MLELCSIASGSSGNCICAVSYTHLIIGGVSFMLYGMISAIGVRNVVENKVDQGVTIGALSTLSLIHI